MAEIVNLNRARKQAAKQEKARIAEENRAFHGLSKAQKALARQQNIRDTQTLDGKKMPADDNSPQDAD